MYPLTKERQDSFLSFFLKLNGAFSFLAVVLIFIFLFKESYLSLSGEGSGFFLDRSWYPLEGQFNLLPMILGSVLVTLGSLFLALPLGLFSALYICFYAPYFLGESLRKIIELFTGIPSVIFGFWGLMKVVPLINEFHPPGQSLLAGMIILALMIFPLISLNLLVAFEGAAKNHYKISQSLGLGKGRFIWFILLPSIKNQMMGGIFLAFGRAMGETMAVLMVCGNIVKVPHSFFDPIRTLTANMALEMAYATGVHRSALFMTGFLLLLVVTFFFILSLFFKKEVH